MRYRLEAVRNSIRKMIVDKAQEAFNLSQVLCPSKTGTLRRSGKIIVAPEMVEIRYSAPYAHIVEKGQAEQTVYVPPGTTSKGTFRNDYVYNRAAIQGHFFVQKAIEATFSEIDKEMDRLTDSGFKLVR